MSTEALAAERPAARVWVPVAGAAVAVGLLYAAMFAVPPLITVFVDDLGLSHPQAGALMSVCLGGFLVTSIVSGRLVGRFGASRVIVAGLVLCGTATVCLTSSASYPLLVAWRGAVGVAGGLIFAPAIAFVALLLKHRANLGVGVLLTGLSSGTTLAYFATGFLAETLDWRWPFWIYGVAALAGAAAFAAVAGAGSRPDGQVGDGPKLPLRAVLATPPFRLLLAALFLGMFVAYGILTWVPPYLDESAGFSTSQISVTSTFMTVVAIPGTFTAGWLAYRTGRPLAVAAAGLVLPASVAVFAASGSPSPALATAVGVISILGTAHALGPMNAVAPVLFGPGGAGTASGLAAAAGMSGAVTSTYAGGWIVGATGGYSAAFAVYATASATASLAIVPLTALSLRRWHRRAGAT